MTQQKIDPNEPGYWVDKNEVDHHTDDRHRTWSNLKLMLVDVSNRLKYLSGDVKHFTRQWIATKYGAEAPNNIDELYQDLRHEWLPQVVDEPNSSQLPASIAAAYKETENDLQKFAVAIEQAHADHRTSHGRTFMDIGKDIVQVLDTLRQHMHVLQIRPHPPVGRDIMDAEERRALDRPDSKAIR